MQKITFEPTIHTFQIDFMNHVSNIVYIEWMEICRCMLLEAVGMPVHEIMARGFGPVLVDTQISYKRQLRLGDQVRVEVWLSKMAKASAWLEFCFVGEANEVVATAQQRGLFMELKTGGPRRLTPEERAGFAPYLADGE